MTNQNEIKPATKAQIDALIELCKEYQLFSAAGFLQLASDELNKVANGKPTCACFMYIGDNVDCPEHGGMFKDHGKVSNVRVFDHALTLDEIKADYQERGDLYAMGMGY